MQAFINKKAKNCHTPQAKLVHYLSEMSFLHARKTELELRGERERTDKLQQELESIKLDFRALQNKKIEVLDEIIFPSMANLVFFFEATSENQELAEVFESDMLDLLGIKRLNPSSEYNHYGFIFENLISGILQMNSRKDDFRVRLIDILQELIFLKVSSLKILDTQKSTSMVTNDLQRAKAWTELLGSRINDLYDWKIIVKGVPGHQYDYPYGHYKYPHGGTKKQREEEFRKLVIKNKPKRTIISDTKRLVQDRINAYKNKSEIKK